MATTETGDYITLEVHCIGCRKEVSPQEVDWLLFRQSGLAVHNTSRCHTLAYERLYGKKEVPKT